MSVRLVREALAARLNRKTGAVTMSYREGGARELWSVVDGERTATAEVAGGAAVDVIVDELAEALNRSPSQTGVDALYG